MVVVADEAAIQIAVHVRSGTLRAGTLVDLVHAAGQLRGQTSGCFGVTGDGLHVDAPAFDDGRREHLQVADDNGGTC